MKSAPHEKEEFKHQFALCTCEMCTAFKVPVVLLWIGTCLMSVYHAMQTTSGATIYVIWASICYICAFPTTAWALGTWLDHREPKKS